LDQTPKPPGLANCRALSNSNDGGVTCPTALRHMSQPMEVRRGTALLPDRLHFCRRRLLGRLQAVVFDPARFSFLYVVGANRHVTSKPAMCLDANRIREGRNFPIWTLSQAIAPSVDLS